MSKRGGRGDGLLKAAWPSGGAPPKPAQLSALSTLKQPVPKFTPQEFARLCVRSQGLEADNQALRTALEKLAAQHKQLESQLQGLSHASQRQQQRQAEEAALRLAELEDQVERQKRALSDLMRTAEAFAQENAELGSRVERLRDEKEDASRANTTMQLSRLQSACLALGGPGGDTAPPGLTGQAGGSFLEQMSTTLMVLSREQPAPAVEPSRARAAAEGLPTDIRRALREMEALRREREALRAKSKRLAAQLDKAQGEREEALRSRAAERRAASLAAAQLQARLEASKRRAEYLAAQVQEKNALLEEKAAYIHKLEQTILASHSRRPASGIAGATKQCGPGAHCREAGQGAACLAAAVAPDSGGADSWGLGEESTRLMVQQQQQQQRGGSSHAARRPEEVAKGACIRPQSAGEQSAGGMPTRPLELAAALEGLEQHGQQVPGQGCRPTSGGRRCAASNNPLFSLAGGHTEASSAASPLRGHPAHQLAAAEAAAGSSPGWVMASPECLASSLTFLHQNSLFQRSPSPVQLGGKAGAWEGLLPPADSADGARAGGSGRAAQQHEVSPPVAGTQPVEQRSQWSPQRGRMLGGRRPAPAPASLPMRDPGASLPWSKGPATSAAAASSQPARATAQLQVAPPRGVVVSPGPAMRRMEEQPAPVPGRGESMLGSLELDELPDEGFGCVADLLEALTPKAAAAAATSGRGPIGSSPGHGKGGEHRARQAAGEVLRLRQQGRGTQERQPGSDAEDGATKACQPRAGQPQGLVENRHVQHREKTCLGGCKLQDLKRGRPNRAADQADLASAGNRTAGYGAAARGRRAADSF